MPKMLCALHRIISVQPPEATASCEVKDTQKSLDHPIGCKIRESVLQILGEKGPERVGKQKEENTKQIETINVLLSDQAELADGSGLCRRLGSLPWHCSHTELFFTSKPRAALNPHISTKVCRAVP